MQWTDEPGAGFTTGEPWLPLSDDVREVNVQAQRGDPASMLALHRALLDLRRREPALSVGGWAPVDAEGDVLAWLRTHGDSRFLVALNLGAGPATLGFGGAGQVVLSTLAGAADRVDGSIALRGDEGVIVRLD